MKTLPPSQNRPPTAERTVEEDALSLKEPTVVEILASQHPDVEPVIAWLKENKAEPTSIINATLAKLAARGRHLPKSQRLLYAKKVVLGEFFVRWAKKHKGTTIRGLQEERDAVEDELRPFQFALMAAGDARAFRRVIPRLAREKTVADCGHKFGDADDFTCFVSNYSLVLGHRFLSNFDTGVRNAAAKAVRYVEMTAVSHYLHEAMAVSRTVPGLVSHLDNSKRMKDRTKLAAKLAYLPSALTKEERRFLRKEHGVEGMLVRRMKIKDVADLLGFPSAATLSRKLYRLRQWARNGALEEPTEGPGDVEVEY